MSGAKEAWEALVRATHALPITRWEAMETAIDAYAEAVALEAEARVREEIATLLHDRAGIFERGWPSRSDRVAATELRLAANAINRDDL